MQQAVHSLTVMPDALSSGIYRELADVEGARVEAAHQRLCRVRTLIGYLVNSRDVPDDMVDMLMMIHDLVDGVMLLTGDEARLANALPTGMDPVWSRPSYAKLRREARI